MRIDFNILWVEDQEIQVKSQEDRIREMFRKEGFRLNVKYAKNVSETRQYLAEDIYSDHIDMVLMDYNLGDGENGADGLTVIREHFLVKDVIFYSANIPQLIDLVNKKKIQGIYCTTRLDLPDMVNQVFETLIKKVLDVEQVRGMVMGTTSDIDESISRSIEMIYERCTSFEKNEIHQIIKEHVNEEKGIKERTTETIKKLENINNIQEIFDEYLLYSSNHRILLLRKILKYVKLNTTFDKKVVRYQNDVVPKRNDLAHISSQKDGFKRVLKNRKGEIFTSESIRDIRKLMLESQDLFEDIGKEILKI